MISRLTKQYRTWLWDDQPQTISFSILRRLARLVAAFADDFRSAEINLRAMSLVYTTILSLVPMLAFSFSLLKAFGVHDRMAPMLRLFLQPIGSQAGALSEQILGFVNNLDVALLGFIGLVLLIYTILRLMYKVQKSLDHTWEVSETPNLSKRVADYLTMFLIGPLLLLSLLTAAAGLNQTMLATEVMQIGFIASLYAWFLASLPFFMIAAGLVFVYWFMPNCKVELPVACIAGGVAAFLWKGSGLLFTNFIASSAQYNVYAGFASVMLFLVWLYLSWLIFLFGSRLAFYLQHPEEMRPEARLQIQGGEMIEQAGLSVLATIARTHYSEAPALTQTALSKQLQLSHKTLTPILAEFTKGGLLCKNNADTPAYIPAVPFDEVPISRALHVIRKMSANAKQIDDPQVAQLSIEIDQMIDQRFSQATLKSLVK